MKICLAESSGEGLFVLYRLFNVSFYNSESTLIKTNMKQFQGMHKTDCFLQSKHVHLFSRNQVLFKFLNCLVFFAVFNDSGSEFQILCPWKLNSLIPLLVVLASRMSRAFWVEGYDLLF